MIPVDLDTVAVLMATYNGEKYLVEQIDSILAQTYKNWVLIIRDDGSADDTVSIIDDYCKAYPDRIFRIPTELSNERGSTKNFAVIQRYVTENYDFSYFMFCDQDDCWLENKIIDTLRVMKENENKGAVLVHTDLKVADEKLDIIADSFFKYRALRTDYSDLKHLLIQNNATGCTMMWNKTLNAVLRNSLSEKDVYQHDWWLSIVASCFGRIVVLDKPTILYRQHGNNEVGATNVNSLGFVLKRLCGLDHVRSTLQGAMLQAAFVLSCFGSSLSTEQYEELSRFSGMLNQNKIQKIWTVVRNGYYKQGALQIIGELLFI